MNSFQKRTPRARKRPRICGTMAPQFVLLKRIPIELKERVPAFGCLQS
jgi:hypothetical protein